MDFREANTHLASFIRTLDSYPCRSTSWATATLGRGLHGAHFRGAFQVVAGRPAPWLDRFAAEVASLLASRPVGEIGVPAAVPMVWDESIERLNWATYKTRPNPVLATRELLRELPARVRFLVPLLTGFPDTEGLFFNNGVVLRLTVDTTPNGTLVSLTTFTENLK